MDKIIRTLYPVKNVSQAKDIFHVLLGVDPYVDGEYYVGYRVNENEFGLVPNGHQQGMTGPVTYLTVADIRARVNDLLNAGATLVEDVRDIGAGGLVATVKDPDGNVLGLLQGS